VHVKGFKHTLTAEKLLIAPIFSSVSTFISAVSLHFPKMWSVLCSNAGPDQTWALFNCPNSSDTYLMGKLLDEDFNNNGIIISL
jgi:hypothetical protein